MKDLIISTRKYREKLIDDPYRPVYHFTVPDDNGRPGDSNGAFFADGVYHLMYLYRNAENQAYHWGHISSVDLLHWRHHPDALTADAGDGGCFSGGAFVDDDGTAYLTFWKFPSKDHKTDHGGIAIAYAKPPYERWERITPIAVEGSAADWGILDMEIDGEIRHLGCADPSNIWKENGRYYMQLGNLCVLDKYGREEDSEPCYSGDWTELFASDDLKTWKFIHRFYKNPRLGADWPDRTEDDMCPSFLPLYDKKKNGQKTDKWLQLFISHNKGCQYYVGTLEGEEFFPKVHGRMSWKDKAYFAPEALIDDENRHIVWTWLNDDPAESFETYGWNGVFGFPRVVWWEDECLHMAPADELDNICYNQHKPDVSESGTVRVKNGDTFRVKAVIDMSEQTKAGFAVRVSRDNKTRTEIYWDKTEKTLVFDAENSGKDGWKIKEEAPLSIGNDELLSLDIFVDKSVIEVYANEKQAICRRVYPENMSDAAGVRLIGRREHILNLDVWEVAPTNPY